MQWKATCLKTLTGKFKLKDNIVKESPFSTDPAYYKAYPDNAFSSLVDYYTSTMES